MHWPTLLPAPPLGFRPWEARVLARRREQAGEEGEVCAVLHLEVQPGGGYASAEAFGIVHFVSVVLEAVGTATVPRFTRFSHP